MPEKPTPEEFNKPVENPETQELSPEVLAMVMPKVEDLNHMHEAAFTVINYESSRRYGYANRRPTSQAENEADLSNILERGLLATLIQSGLSQVKRSGDRKYFRQQVNKGALDTEYWVYLQYMPENGQTIEDMKSTIWWRNAKPVAVRPFPNIGLFVDVRKYKNFVKKDGRPYNPIIFRKPTGVSDNFSSEIPPELIDYQKDRQDEIVIPARVGPREFFGMVLGKGNQTEAEFEAEIRRVSIMMKDKYKDKPKLLIPIYDESGNLLWPKRMSHEEIKNFVGERDKSKELDSGSGPK